MSKISKQQIWQWLEADHYDPALTARVEAAIDQDPEVAGWYQEILEEMSPGDEAREALGEMLGAYDQSIWLNLPQAAGDPTAGENSVWADLQLPDGKQMTVQLRTDNDRVRVILANDVPGWKLAGLVAHLPAEAPPYRVTLSFDAASLPADQLPGGRESRPATAPDGEAATAWTSPRASDPHGLQAWLSWDDDSGVSVRCSAPVTIMPLPPLHYRFSFQDPATGRGQELSGWLTPEPTGAEEAAAHSRLDISWSAFAALPAWELEVCTGEQQAASFLDASAFQLNEICDAHSLPLNPHRDEQSADRPAYLVTFHNDRQRELWNDEQARRVLYLEMTRE